MNDSKNNRQNPVSGYRRAQDRMYLKLITMVTVGATVVVTVGVVLSKSL